MIEWSKGSGCQAPAFLPAAADPPWVADSPPSLLLRTHPLPAAAADLPLSSPIPLPPTLPPQQLLTFLKVEPCTPLTPSPILLRPPPLVQLLTFLKVEPVQWSPARLRRVLNAAIASPITAQVGAGRGGWGRVAGWG